MILVSNEQSDSSRPSIMHGQKTYEKGAIAKSTKHVTLASSGRAVSSERMMVCKGMNPVTILIYKKLNRHREFLSACLTGRVT